MSCLSENYRFSKTATNMFLDPCREGMFDYKSPGNLLYSEGHMDKILQLILCLPLPRWMSYSTWELCGIDIAEEAPQSQHLNELNTQLSL